VPFFFYVLKNTGARTSTVGFCATMMISLSYG
jgi:hypothetical protein